MARESPATMVEALRDRAVRTPDRQAFLFLEGGEREGARLTFGELDARARAVARWLISLGAGGRQVLLMHPPGLEFVASFFGCLYAGSVAVPLSSSLLSRRNLARLEYLVRDSGAELILTDAASAANFRRAFAGQEGQPRLPALLASDEVDSAEAAGWLPASPGPEALAYLQYTSGSTSEPRGVVLRHRNIIHNQRMIRSATGNTEGTVAVSWLPHFHDMGLVGVIQQTVYAGLSAVLMAPLEFVRKPVRWLRAISKYRAAESGGPNFAYDLCVERVTAEEAAGLDLSCWKRALDGSEPVRAGTLEAFADKFAASGFRPAAFFPCYGLAEATLLVTGGGRHTAPVIRSVDNKELERGRFSEVADAAGDSRRLVGCGQSWDNESLAIVDADSHRRCAEGTVGEIWVAGPHVAEGYWNQAELSRETFNAWLADTGEGPFLRTGDLGCVVDGELFVTGRLKDLIILRGRNHYPQDIEATVAISHPSLRPSCSAAFSVDVNGQEELVVVQEMKGRPLPEKVPEIYRAIRQALAEDHAVNPHAIVLLKANTIPRTTSGKIRRSVCRDHFLKNGFQETVFC